MTTLRKRRFSSPTVLTDSTPVLGATAKEWHDALTGNMEETLAEVKKRVEELEKTNSSNKPNL